MRSRSLSTIARGPARTLIERAEFRQRETGSRTAIVDSLTESLHVAASLVAPARTREQLDPRIEHTADANEQVEARS